VTLTTTATATSSSRRQRAPRRRRAARLGEPRAKQAQALWSSWDSQVAENRRARAGRLQDRAPSLPHWKLGFAGPVATLTLDVSETAGSGRGYELKLNFLRPRRRRRAVRRDPAAALRHPEVGAVIVTSGRSASLRGRQTSGCSRQSAHGWKVNFCKFTNETRNANGGSDGGVRQVYLCAVNGRGAGGGYEAGAGHEWIVMADDREHGRVRSGGPAARRAPRHRRPHAAGRQSAACAATAPTSSARRGGNQGRAGRGMGVSSTRSPRALGARRGCGAGAPAEFSPPAPIVRPGPAVSP